MHKELPETQKKLINIESEAEILRKIRNFPKIDLHRHLTGSIGANLAIDISTKHDIYLPTYIKSELHEIITRRPRPLSHRDYFDRWKILNRLFKTKESTFEIVQSIIEDAINDNVVYIELRMGPRGFLGETELKFEDFIEAVASAIKACETKFKVITRCILGISRHETFSRISNSETRERMYMALLSIISKTNYFVGVDLNGIESEDDLDRFQSFFNEAFSRGMKITIHAGELGNEKNIIDAIIRLNANRIGHGLAAVKNEKIMEMMSSKDIPLEICPTSNWFLHVISSTRELPLKQLSENRVAYLISTDNPAICQTDLSQELFKIYYPFGFSLEGIKKIISKSLNYAFVDEETKGKILEKLKGGVINGGESIEKARSQS